MNPSAYPLSSGPSSRGRIQHPSPCNLIHHKPSTATTTATTTFRSLPPPTPSGFRLAPSPATIPTYASVPHAAAAGLSPPPFLSPSKTNLGNESPHPSPRAYHPSTAMSFSSSSSSRMMNANNDDSATQRAMMEEMRSTLPYPDVMTSRAVGEGSPRNNNNNDDSFLSSATAPPPPRRHSPLFRDLPFNQVPSTCFATTSAAQFVFSGQQVPPRRKRKSLENGNAQKTWKKVCSEEKMVAHMSRLSLATQSQMEQQQCPDQVESEDDDEDWEGEEEEENRPFQMCLSPELQCLLKGNEILPGEYLSKISGPPKSGMELVIWRPPGSIVPAEIIASISSSHQSPPPSSPSSSSLSSSPSPNPENQRPQNLLSEAIAQSSVLYNPDPAENVNRNEIEMDMM